MPEEENTKSVKIEKLGPDLKGSGELNGRTYSFRYVNIGDTVEFETRGRGIRRYDKVHGYIRGQEFSSFCRVYGECGGCAGQHISYAGQFNLKTGALCQSFQEKFGLNLKPVAAAKDRLYRNRMDFTVHPGLTGLHQAENFRKIIDIEECMIQSAEANRELAIFREWILRYPDLPYDRKQETGFLKYVTIRKGENLVVILTFIQEFEESSLKEEIKKSFAAISGADNIIFCYNRKKSEVSADGKSEVVRADAFFRSLVLNRIIEVPFNSFFQPNPPEFENILQFIKGKFVGTPRSGKFLDMFCGSGFFSLLLGDMFDSVTGYDSVPSSIESARISFERLYPGKKNKFEAIDLYQEKSFQTVMSDMTNSVMVVDPPRAGLGEKFSRFIVQYGPEIIFYVSCNPWNQIKDLEILSESYNLIDAMVCDPFPQTPHLESVVFLHRKEL